MPLWPLRNALEFVDADSIPQLGRIWRLPDEVSSERGMASWRPTGSSRSGNLEESRFHPVCMTREIHAIFPISSRETGTA